MKTIYKYPLILEGRQTLALPLMFFTPLDVQFQGDQLCLWALVEPDSQTFTVDIYIYGTGQTIPGLPGEYLGTVQQGQFVWHVFMKR